MSRCHICKYDWDGHCVLGYDNWKMQSKQDDNCGEFEERGVNYEEKANPDARDLERLRVALADGICNCNP